MAKVTPRPEHEALPVRAPRSGSQDQELHGVAVPSRRDAASRTAQARIGGWPTGLTPAAHKEVGSLSFCRGLVHGHLSTCGARRPEGERVEARAHGHRRWDSVLPRHRVGE
jgi:hypothetical protein